LRNGRQHPAIGKNMELDIWQYDCNISTMIFRKHYSDRVKKALGRNPVVALLGPRQCGKTTLARQMIPAGHPQYFDLEDPVVAADACQDLIENRPELPILRPRLPNSRGSVCRG
jgi:predicted AAA+ superfamily ATPase